MCLILNIIHNVNNFQTLTELKKIRENILQKAFHIKRFYDY